MDGTVGANESGAWLYKLRLASWGCVGMHNASLFLPCGAVQAKTGASQKSAYRVSRCRMRFGKRGPTEGTFFSRSAHRFFGFRIWILQIYL